MRFSHTRLGIVVSRLALWISVIVAIGIPGGYLLVAQARLDHDLTLIGELKATRLSKYVYTNRELWQYHRVRLAEIVEIREADEDATQERIFDAGGRLVLETGDAPPRPVIRARVPVVVEGSRIATIEIATSLRPTLAVVAVLASFSAALGLAILWMVRRLLLRTLDRTLMQLDASQARYRHVVESMLDAVFTTDPLLVTYVSPAAFRVLGKEANEIIGLQPHELCHPEDVPAMLAGVRAAYRAPGTIQSMQLRTGGRLDEGRWVDLRFKTTGTPDAQGHYALIGVVRDIDAQVQLEQAQREDVLKLRAIVDSSGASIALVNSHQRIVLANRTFLDTVGKPADAVIGQRFLDVAECGEAAPGLTTWFAGDQRDAFGFDYVSRSGAHPRYLRVTASRAQDENRKINYSLLLGVDETERRAAEVRALDAARLATLGEMATGIAHEINQPLTVVQFAAEALTADIEDGLHRDDPEGHAKEVLRHARRMLEQTQRAAGIVRRLQGFARRGDDAPQPFDLNDAVRGAVDLVSEQMRLARIDLDLVLPEDTLNVVGHANRLQQVVINLLINARDAIDEDRAREGTKTRQDHIQVRIRRDGATGQALIEIADSGSGIPEHVLPRLFESFYTTKPKGKGTGLGLSISAEIAEEFGGTLEAENRPEGGALFRMRLPAGAELSAAA